jgi:hypothetical protein
MAEQKKYLHQPAVVGGRPSWVVSDAATGEVLGVRPQSAANALDDALRAGNNRVSSIEVRDRTAPGTPTRSYDLVPDPTRPLEARVLPPAGPLTHQRTECPACKAERVQLPPALPTGTEVSS